jgi:hypothetical protein
MGAGRVSEGGTPSRYVHWCTHIPGIQMRAKCAYGVPGIAVGPGPTRSERPLSPAPGRTNVAHLFTPRGVLHLTGHSGGRTGATAPDRGTSPESHQPKSRRRHVPSAPRPPARHVPSVPRPFGDRTPPRCGRRCQRQAVSASSVAGSHAPAGPADGPLGAARSSTRSGPAGARAGRVRPGRARRRGDERRSRPHKVRSAGSLRR